MDMCGSALLASLFLFFSCLCDFYPDMLSFFSDILDSVDFSIQKSKTDKNRHKH
jgi:hypothetical protein